jgi:DNA uptake protein ComE-like DNA-binding protein
MRKFTKLILGCALLSISMMACKQAKESEKAGEATSEPTEASIEEASTTTIEATNVLNANLATEEELNSIGLSEETVAQIIENRPFLSMNDFDALLGAEVDKEELYKKVFVPFNLNTTAEADFKMIPGVGDRMAHEFEEYRPYTSIQQFRREIGKYVDEDEVARYEYYVFVPVELNTASEEDIKALPGVGDRMAHEFEEYRPYTSMAQFRKEIGKYVDDKELARLERFVYLKE